VRGEMQHAAGKRTDKDAVSAKEEKASNRYKKQRHARAGRGHGVLGETITPGLRRGLFFEFTL
jgi:hypothetical protein